MQELRELLEKYKDVIFPVMGIAYDKEEYTPIDLGADNPGLHNLVDDNFENLESYILTRILETKARFAFGGYGERRALYEKSDLFIKKGKQPRSIHLGIDIWAPTNFPIHAPLNGKVHSTGYNDSFLDYGSTIILEHQLEDQTFHTLYGHVTYDTVVQYKMGDLIGKGQPFTAVGTKYENGGWYPHLHFQLIIDMQDHRGDYPGVVAPDEAEMYKINCPDPSVIIFATL